jgi:hypothetical protein
LKRQNLEFLATRTGPKPGAVSAQTAGQPALTAGQIAARKAVQTRQANQAAAGGTPKPAAAAVAAPVQPAEPVTLTVDATGGGISVTCSAFAWSILAEIVDGALTVGDLLVSLTDADAETVMETAREMVTLQNLLSAAMESADDESLPLIVSTLAGHYRATSIELLEPSGRREIRRGQSYMALHQMTEAYMERNKQAAA